ncbi:MAG TPA: nitrogen regulation protein NR(I) [Verrucomicrobiae bacterium]|nr:nitrogen regulation protein NR(I) [Verrucomicrobiae bacterium]
MNASALVTWVVDDDESIRWVLEKALARAGVTVRSFAAPMELLEAIGEGLPDVLISDIRMPGMNGLDLLARLRADHPQLPIIITTAHSDLDAAVMAYRGGAFEYLPKPFDVDAVAALVKRAGRKAKGADEPPPRVAAATLIGEAPAMQEVFRAVGRLAASQINVLVTGETGVGKELVARALHANSPRKDKPFIAVNTAAIPKDLMESEFFGHERGAFTGAQTQRRGRFEQADGGTLFLDEIGDMPHDLQTRLLRVLSDGEFYRVGGTVPIRVDVRVVAATHQDLEQAVRQHRFREDLFHRLNVIRVRVPSLRQRRDDIPLLLAHFLAQAAIEMKTAAKRPRPEVLAHLQQLDWPGNVRQLENACRWLTVMAPGRDVHLADLPPELKGESPAVVGAALAATVSTSAPASPAHQDWSSLLRQWAELKLRAGQNDLLGEALPEFERTLIRIALAECGGQRQEAARRLGWGRNTLTRKIKELGLTEV